jgi:hypothetical protein
VINQTTFTDTSDFGNRIQRHFTGAFFSGNTECGLNDLTVSQLRFLFKDKLPCRGRIEAAVATKIPTGWCSKLL